MAWLTRAFRPPDLRAPVAYCLAVLVPVAVAAVQHSLVPRPSIAPFVGMYLAVTVVAWAGGVGPGLVAVLLSAAIGNYTFILPWRELKLSGPALVATLMYLPTAAAIAALAGSLRTLAASLQKALAVAGRKTALARKFQILADHSRDIVLVVRVADGAILEANAAALSAYGYDRDELLALTIGDLRAPDTRPELEGQLRTADERGTLFETVHRRKDGTALPVEVSAQGGTIDGERVVVSVLRDITERKRAEESLRQTEQRVRVKLESILSPGGDVSTLELQDLVDAPALQALVSGFYELTRIPLSIIDLKGKVLVGAGWQEICTKFHRVHGATCAYCIESDTQLTAAIQPGEFRRYRCKNQLWDAATPIVIGDRHLGNVFTGQFFFDDEQPDRELFRAQARRYGFPEEEYLAALDAVPRLRRDVVKHGMDFLVKLAEMLSKLGYANVRLARSLREGDLLMASLRDTDRRRTEFLAMLSHELRNPLTPIQNSLYVLARTDPGGEAARRALAVIERQTAHLTRLVDDLLDATRIAHGKIKLHRAALDLTELVRQIAEDHRATIERPGVELGVELPDQPVRVDGDRTRLAQSLGNLLGNAAKFTAEGRVLVSLRRHEESRQAEIRVTDTGVGIPAEVLPRLFQPFVQGQTSLDRGLGGLGLGLAVARSLVEMHGGTLSASSGGDGKGSEFVLRLPLAEELGAAVVPFPTVVKRGRRVLIIEDVVDSADSLREALAINRHVVETAYDGIEGLEKARAFRPEVILCDIGLPGMDGYAVARAIRADPALRGTLLIALTGYASAEDQSAALAAGFDLHMAKPPQLDYIERVLARAAAG